MKNSENLRTKCKSGCFRFTLLGFCCDGLISPAGLAYMFRFPISDFVMISENCFFPFSSYAHGSTCIWKDKRQTPRRTSRENMKNSENLCTKCQSGWFRFTLLGFCCGGLISPAGLAYMFRFPISDFVMILQRTVSFKFRLMHMDPRAYEKTKGKLPGEHRVDSIGKLKRCINKSGAISSTNQEKTCFPRLASIANVIAWFV